MTGIFQDNPWPESSPSDMTLGIKGCEDESDEPEDSGKDRFVLVIGIDGM